MHNAGTFCFSGQVLLEFTFPGHLLALCLKPLIFVFMIAMSILLRVVLSSLVGLACLLQVYR
jgi:hypothetical protein